MESMIIDDLGDLSDLSEEDPIVLRAAIGPSHAPPQEGDPAVGFSRRQDLGRETAESEEQRLVRTLAVRERRSVFFSGEAGTGKSYVARAIIAALREEGRSVAVTAPTGLAASNIGGQTLHSWGGLPIDNVDVASLTAGILRSPEATERWRRTQVLFIDEVSMVHPSLFDALEKVAQVVRRREQVWGGIQLLLCGDFYQLAPVQRPLGYCFQAAAWSKSVERSVLLRQNFRQSEPVLRKHLNAIRLGRIDEEGIRFVKSLEREPLWPSGITATQLFSNRRDCQYANTMALRQVEGPTRTFRATDEGEVGQLEKGVRAERTLHLKVSAQVMLIKNIDETLVNGTTGIIEGWQAVGGSEEEYPAVSFLIPGGSRRYFITEPMTFSVDRGQRRIASRTQVPLLLSYALTIHKSQSLSLPFLRVDLDKVFAKGQVYAALSRAVSSQYLQVLHFRTGSFQPNKVVDDFYANLLENVL